MWILGLKAMADQDLQKRGYGAAGLKKKIFGPLGLSLV